jgi:hypothetical protein
MTEAKRIRKPKDKFQVGDRINVTSPRSKHHNRTGTISSLGMRRLTVHFDDHLPGSFVDYAHATKDDGEQAPTERTNNRTVLAPTTSNEVDEIGRLLEHLAFTAAAIVSSAGRGTKREQQLASRFHSCFDAQCTVLGEIARTPSDGE